MFQRDIQCFVKLAECLNFTTAADKLYMSQPGLSKIISNLEQNLDVRLFSRSTRSVRLTTAGEQFLVLCRGFLRQCEMLKEHHPQDAINVSGSLIIGIGDLNENRYFPQIVSEFSAQQPHCGLSVKRYNPEDLLKAIDSGEADFGVMTSYAIPGQGFEYLVYYPSPLMLVVSPTHPLAGREKVHISELKDEHFVFIDRTLSRADKRIFEVCVRGNFTPKIVTETNSLSSMLMLVTTGVGISLNFLLHKESFNYDLRFIPLDLGEEPAEPVDGAALVWKQGNTNPAAVPFIRCSRGCVSRFRAAGLFDY